MNIKTLVATRNILLILACLLSTACSVNIASRHPEQQDVSVIHVDTERSQATVNASADLYIYPNNGQDQALQKRDRYECHVWASQQTGFDPSTYQAPQPVYYSSYEKPQHRHHSNLDPVTGAATGAALGAVGGAIAGNAGKGAAIGAGVGAVVGAFHTLISSDIHERNSEHSSNEEVTVYADQTAEVKKLRYDYNRAISACLEGRGYTVK